MLQIEIKTDKYSTYFEKESDDFVLVSAFDSDNDIFMQETGKNMRNILLESLCWSGIFDVALFSAGYDF